MHWTDKAIVLSSKKYGETSASVRLFARSHGVYAGIVRGAHSKTNRGVLQPGNIVNATWQARLPEHMGIFKCELLQAHAALIMQDAPRLSALDSACSVLTASLPERHPYVKLYDAFAQWLEGVRIQDSDWMENYVRLELLLLAESGFGLDLSACAATGTTENLIYVSPKSGRAVSREAGEPYKEKLLVLPEFLTTNSSQKNFCESPLPRSGGVSAIALATAGGLGRGNNLMEKARELRKNLTDAEKTLWYHLRAHRFEGYGFRRQYPIGDRYIADFTCLEKMLIIELDGGQHSEQVEYDKERTQFLEQRGYRVLRFWNNEIFENIDGVLETILQTLNTPSLTLPPSGRGNSAQSPLPRSGGGLGRGQDVVAGLRLTGYFLDSWLLSPHNRKLPAARQRLLDMIKEYDGAEA